MGPSRRAALLVGLLAVSAACLPRAAAVVCQSYRSAADCNGRVTSSGECVWDSASRTCVVGAALPPGRVAVTSIDEPSFAMTSSEPVPTAEGEFALPPLAGGPAAKYRLLCSCPTVLTSRHSEFPNPPLPACCSSRQDTRPASDPSQRLRGPPHPRRLHLRAAAQLGQGPLLLPLLAQPDQCSMLRLPRAGSVVPTPAWVHWRPPPPPLLCLQCTEPWMAEGGFCRRTCNLCDVQPTGADVQPPADTSSEGQPDIVESVEGRGVVPGAEVSTCCVLETGRRGHCCPLP